MSKKLIIIIAIVAVVAIAAVVLGVVLTKDKPVEDNKEELAQNNQETLAEDNEEVSAGNIEGTLEEIMAKVYAGIPEENLPALMDMPVDSETVEGFLGTTEVSIKEAVAREPMMPFAQGRKW